MGVFCHRSWPLLAASLALAGAVKHKTDFLSACSCSCCETQARTAALRSTGLKCSLLVEETSSCGGECQDLKADPGEPSTDMSIPEEGVAADYGLFCLKKCEPSKAQKDEEDLAANRRVSLPCVDAGTQVNKSADTSLSVQSPATVALLKGTSAGIEETGALVADAEGKKAKAMAMEAASAVAEAQAAAARARSASDLVLAQNRGDLSNEVKAALTDSAERAGLFARSAATAAKKAAEELKELEEVPQMAAKEAADEAVSQLKKQDALNHQVMDTLEANIKPPPPPPPYPAAGRAAEPYALAISTATEAESRYKAKASTLTDQADMLRLSARNVDKRAEPYEKAGQEGLAKIVHQTAQDLAVQAANLDTKAIEASSEAAHIEVTLPKYGAAAGTAVARANILGQQKWMPPAPDAAA